MSLYNELPLRPQPAYEGEPSVIQLPPSGDRSERAAPRPHGAGRAVAQMRSKLSR
jgi:hypothetical protein